MVKLENDYPFHCSRSFWLEWLPSYIRPSRDFSFRMLCQQTSTGTNHLWLDWADPDHQWQTVYQNVCRFVVKWAYMPLANTKVRNSTGIFSSIYDIALAATLNFDLGYSFEWFNITLWSDGRHLPQLLVAMTSHVMGCRVSLILICNASTCAHLIEKNKFHFLKRCIMMCRTKSMG